MSAGCARGKSPVLRFGLGRGEAVPALLRRSAVAASALPPDLNTTHAAGVPRSALLAKTRGGRNRWKGNVTLFIKKTHIGRDQARESPQKAGQDEGGFAGVALESPQCRGGPAAAFLRGHAPGAPQPVAYPQVQISHRHRGSFMLARCRLAVSPPGTSEALRRLATAASRRRAAPAGFRPASGCGGRSGRGLPGAGCAALAGDGTQVAPGGRRGAGRAPSSFSSPRPLSPGPSDTPGPSGGARCALRCGPLSGHRALGRLCAAEAPAGPEQPRRELRPAAVPAQRGGRGSGTGEAAPAFVRPGCQA